MKFIKLLVLNLFLCFAIVSCVSVKTSEVLNLNYDVSKGAEDGGDFIEFLDGKIIKGEIEKFKLQLGLINKNKGAITMDKVSYKSNDILAFQMDSSFYRKLKGTTYFMQRKKAGKINLYFRHYSSESGVDSKGKSYFYPAYDLHWLQKGFDSEIQKFNVKLLATMVADNVEAYNLVTKYENTKRRNRSDTDIDKAINIYNKN
jgi:hypothetical protein